MVVKYSVTYLENQSSGFSLFNFFRSQQRIKCGKCKNHAVMKVSDRDDESNSINLCVECYNFYSIEKLLTDQKQKGPRVI